MQPLIAWIRLGWHLGRALPAVELTECLDYRTLFDQVPARPIRERTG